MFQVTDGIKNKKKSTPFPFWIFFFWRASQSQSFNSCCAIVWDYYSLFSSYFSFFESFFFYINVNMDVVVLKESVLMAVLFDLGMERLLISPRRRRYGWMWKSLFAKKKKKNSLYLSSSSILVYIIRNYFFFRVQLTQSFFPITFIIYQPHSIFYTLPVIWTFFL